MITSRRLALCLFISLSLGLSAQAQSSPQVKFVTSAGEFVVEVYPDKTPNTVENFLSYVNDGHYNGTIFHRVINNFMIQGAAKGGLHNSVGTRAMARTNNPHSATAQFFINVKDNDFLDHRAPSGQGWGYVAFGKVISGMDVVTRIRQMPTGPGG
ncbi:MAG: peptidylprolyl isomerase, partial [Burkholderiales bacterium]|nr:peptidylprolyl isomerase [Burkholderiales bacterium]